jgi:glutamate-1-semialdehyde 2,1-aminomutase
VATEIAPDRISELLASERIDFAERAPASGAMFRRATGALAGGVTSSFQRGDPWPVYLARGEGSRVWDLDGNEYLDFHNGFSAMVQGHAHPAIRAAVERRLPLGTHFGAPTEESVAVAEQLAARFGLPRWRFMSSGTESTMSAIRIARAYTGRDDVVKIFGAYHGHHDTAMVSVRARRTNDTEWPPSVPWGEGIPRATVDRVQTVTWGQRDAMDRRLAELAAAGRPPACVIMEPAITAGRVVPPPPGYLRAVREITRRRGVVLIFDEVKTGLTIAAGGGTERFGVKPDIVALAKALGGGLPSGAIGMSTQLAEVVETGRVHQVGTYSGNPLAMAAARASLEQVLTPTAYERFEALGDRMRAGCEAVVAEHGLPAQAVALGAKGSIHVGDDVAELHWLWSMNRGLFLTPGGGEWSLSVAHDEAAVDRYLEVFAELAGRL